MAKITKNAYYSHTSVNVISKNLLRDAASILFFAYMILCTYDVFIVELHVPGPAARSTSLCCAKPGKM